MGRLAHAAIAALAVAAAYAMLRSVPPPGGGDPEAPPPIPLALDGEAQRAPGRLAAALALPTLADKDAPNHVANPEPFRKLHAHLERSFPLLYQRLQHERVRRPWLLPLHCGGRCCVRSRCRPALPRHAASPSPRCPSYAPCRAASPGQRALDSLHLARQRPAAAPPAVSLPCSQQCRLLLHCMPPLPLAPRTPPPPASPCLCAAPLIRPTRPCCSAMAHLDVVPAPTDGPYNWTHGPFSGAIADGCAAPFLRRAAPRCAVTAACTCAEASPRACLPACAAPAPPARCDPLYIECNKLTLLHCGRTTRRYLWGRGALDDKVTVLQQLEAVSLLLRQGHTPQRTLYLAFGHDEEVGGERGGCGGAAPAAWRGERALRVAPHFEARLPGIASCPASARPGPAQACLAACAPCGAGAAAIAALLASRGVELELVLDEGGAVMMDGLGKKDLGVAVTDEVGAGWWGAGCMVRVRV